MTKCILCLKDKPISKSHIIPKFVSDWIKETSATGLLRSGWNPNKRVQDTIKNPLLCIDCEKEFSVFENYFAKNIFYPFHRGEKNFTYNDTLRKFILSICWRTLHLQFTEIKDTAPRNVFSIVSKAIEEWSKYLANDRDDFEPYECHIFFLDNIKNSYSLKLPDRFESYLFRSIDATFAIGKEFKSEKDIMFVYVKLPGIILISSIFPSKIPDMEKTKVENSGILSPPQHIYQKDIGSFIIHRSEEAFKRRLSDKQMGKILESIYKNPERAIKSKSFEAILAERRRKGIKDSWF